MFAPRGQARTRPTLTQDAIVAAAVKILDGEGTDALTFRRLASDLGVGVASLYWHVPSKDALLDLALDAVAGQLYAALPASAKNARTARRWRADLREAAVQMYVELGRRGWAGEQQLVSRDRGPNQMRIWEYLARIMYRAGFDDKDGFYAMSAVLSYVLGYAVQESAAARSDVGRDEHLAQMAAFFDTLDPVEFASVHRMGAIFASHDQREQFESGLDLLLDGLEARLSR